MQKQNQTENGQIIQIIQNLLQPNVEAVLVKGEMAMVMVNIQRDEDSDFLYTVLEYHLGRLYVAGVGLDFHDAIRDALRRAAEAGDAKKMKKIRALEAAHRLGGE